MSKGFSSAVLAILIVALLGVIAAAYFAFGRNNLNQAVTSDISRLQVTNAPTLQSKTSSTVQQVKNYPGTKEFTSPKLKIVFNYLPSVNGMTVNVQEIGDKVYVNLGDRKIEDGQFVEVFSKSPSDSIKEAVKKQFLSGKSNTECFVVDSPAVFKNYPSNYQAVEISFPKPTDSNEPWWSGTDKCSADYAQTNGIRYFLGDSLHPEMLLFFSIGQYSINAGTDLTWQDTIRFLN